MTSPVGFFSPIPDHGAIRALPAIAQLVLGRLYWHRNRVSGQCNPRHETLARTLGCSESTIQRGIRMLRECGVIGATKGRRCNQYEIRPQSEWRKPLKRPPCPVNCDEAEMKRQDDFILNEQEAFFLKENAAAASRVVELPQEVGGDSPAALCSDCPPKGWPTDKTRCDSCPAQTVAEKTKTAQPRHAPPAPIPPAKPRPPVKPPVKPPATPPPPPTEPPAAVVRNERTPEAMALVAELLPQHPIAGNPAGAARAVAGVLSEGATPEAIRASHAQFRRLWAQFKPGRFIPMLARWISDNDWRYPPDEKQIQSVVDRTIETPEEKTKSEARRRASQMQFLDELRKGHFLPPQIERQMMSRGFTREEIRAEQVYQGWRVAS